MTLPFPRHPWKQVDASVLQATRTVATMLSVEEQLFYHWLTADWLSGAGTVVELGCFVGGSTARLAQGLRIAGNRGKVHAYDRFQADERAKRAHLYPAGISPFDGTDILPLARALLDPWKAHVALHPGQIEEQDWTGGPIELLVMDASKTKATTDRMAEIFFPHLIAGRSLVVQQDYLHWRQPWIAVQMHLMADCFTPVAHAPPDTVAFLCTAPVTQEILARGRVAGLAPEQMIAALHGARGSLRPLRIARRVNALIAAARANPAVDIGWKMQRPAR